MKAISTDSWRDEIHQINTTIQEGLFALAQDYANTPATTATIEENVSQPNISSDSPEQMPSVEDAIKSNIVKPSDGIPPFPIDGFPMATRMFIREIARVYGVPVDFPAAAVLAAVAAALRKQIHSNRRYKNYPQLWIMIVASSGIGKSEPLKLAFEPLEESDRNAAKQYDCESRAFEERMFAAGSRKEQAPLQRERPVYKQCLITDTTPEALYRAIAINDGITLYRDELAGWFKDFGRYNKSGEVQNYLSIFNNRQIQLARKGDGNRLITDPYLSIAGTIQPDVLRSTLRQEQMLDNGMAQRFLFAFPDNVKRAYVTAHTLDPELTETYARMLHKAEHFSEMEVSEIKFDNEALKLIEAFDREITDRTNATADDYLQGLYSKMNIHLHRLLLVLWFIHEGERYFPLDGEPIIEGKIVRQASEICRYFIATGEKVYDMIRQGAPLKSLGNEVLIREVVSRYRVKSQTELAKVLGITQQAVSKMLIPSETTSNKL